MSSHTWGVDEYMHAPLETRNLVHAWLKANVGDNWKELGVVAITLHDAGTYTIEHTDYVQSKRFNHPVPRVVHADGESRIATKLRHGPMVTPFPIVFTE